VIAVDTNVLIHADRAELPLHKEALARLRGLAEGDEAWALPLFCVGEFVRVVSHPRLFDPPTPAEDALESIEALFASPSIRVLHPGARYWPLFCELVRRAGASGNLVFDAQIAALCLEHGAGTILTEDRDFTRFPGITVQSLKDGRMVHDAKAGYRSRPRTKARATSARRSRSSPA
jgi:hypothetical protein